MADMGYNPQAYYWIAFYKDKQALPQYDPVTGDENLFMAVDTSQLKAFGLFPFGEDLAKKIKQSVKVAPIFRPHIVFLNGNQRLVFTRRNSISYRKDGTVIGRGTVYLLGWQMTVNDKNYQSIMYIYEDGGVKLADRFDANEGGLYGNIK